MSATPPPAQLWRYVLPYWRKILLGMLMSLLTVGLNILIPFCSRYVVDGLTAGNLQHHHLVLLLGAYLLAALCATLVSYWMRHIPLRIGHSVETSIRGDLFEHLSRMDRAFYRTQHTGDLMTRISSDTRTIAMAVGQGLMQNCRLVFVFFLTFGVMFRINVPLTLLILLLVPFMTGTFAWFARRVKKGHIAVQEQQSALSSFSQETFTGIQTLKSFAVEPRWRALFQEQNNTLVDENMRMARIHEAIWPLAAFWFAIGSVTILIVGGRYVIQGRMTLGELVQFTQYLLYIQWPLLSLGWILSLLQRGHASWQRIREVLDQQSAIVESAEVDRCALELSGSISFEHVSLFAGDIPLLQDINLSIPSGARVGITGPTGAGKTLLVSLLPRIMDVTSGRLCVDGKDVREYPLGMLREQIGMAEQEPTLFSDTLSNNIAFGMHGHAEDKILMAADIAHLHADVEQLPDQYDTLIGERGVSLSGGQRQRTSISRAIARSPEILILDDVLASVDTETEAAILHKLQPIFAARTTLFVSHRVSTLRDMDVILVLEDGRLTQQGTHAELIRQEGYYRRLHEMQQLAAVV